jgi:FkbM family methyltransferase
MQRFEVDREKLGAFATRCARIVLAVLLRTLTAIGAAGWADAVAYRSRARRLAVDARAVMRRWGIRFELNLNDNVQRTFYYTGWYERSFLKFLRSELRADDTYVDVGAHVGIDAAFVARLAPRGKVVAFEAAPDTAETLRDSLGHLENVEVVGAALGGHAGRLTLRENPKWHPEDAATRTALGTGPPVANPVLIRFDDWAKRLNRMDVLKIDVEGSEFDVLKGMTESIRGLQPRLIAVELYGPHLEAAGTSEQQIATYLGDLGYVHEQTIGHNAIFRHRAAAEAALRDRAPKRRVVLAPAAVTLAVLTAWLARATVVGDYHPIVRPLSRSWISLALIPAAIVLVWIALATALALLGRREQARALAGFVPDCLLLLARLVADPRVTRRQKLVLSLLIAYLAVPVDLIPDVIPILGELDEAILMVLVLRWVVRKGGDAIVRQHWPGPDASLRLVLRLAT